MGITVDRHHGAAARRERQHRDDARPRPGPRTAGAMPRATPTAGISTAVKRCCTASVAGSCSTPAAVMPISVPGTGWCCHRIPRTQPPSAPKGSAALRPPAKVRCELAKHALPHDHLHISHERTFARP